MGLASPFTVLTVGGSDPTGGAGIQGDLATFNAHGVHGAAVVAALTAQNHLGVAAVEGVGGAFVTAQIEAVLGQVTPHAMKTGMLWSAEVVRAVANAFARSVAPLVVDPVLAASAGGGLALEGLCAALAGVLVPLAAVVTPNLDEAARFLGRRPEAGEEGDAADALRTAWGARAVLVKGGHATGTSSTDALATRDGVTTFSLPRIATPHGHGSGCALSASIAVRLGRGDALVDAVAGAKAYVHRALLAARPLGAGRGPVRHAVPADPPAGPDADRVAVAAVARS